MAKSLRIMAWTPPTSEPNFVILTLIPSHPYSNIQILVQTVMSPTTGSDTWTEAILNSRVPFSSLKRRVFQASKFFS